MSVDQQFGPVEFPRGDATALYRFFDADGLLLYVGVSLCQVLIPTPFSNQSSVIFFRQHCATWRFENRLRSAQKRGEVSMDVVAPKEDA